VALRLQTSTGTNLSKAQW